MNAKLSHLSRRFREKIVTAYPLIEATFFMLCIGTILFYFGPRQLSISLVLVSIAIYFVVGEFAEWLPKLVKK